MRVSFWVPKPSEAVASTLLGLLGLVAVVVAIGGLAGTWWAVLAGGAVAVAVARLWQLAELEAQKAAAGQAPAVANGPRPVPKAASE